MKQLILGKKYLAILFALLLLLSLPPAFSLFVNGSFIATASPLWQMIDRGKKNLLSPLVIVDNSEYEEMISLLEMENLELRQTVEQLRESAPINGQKETPEKIYSFAPTKANVIFRSLSQWNRCLWVDVGSSSSGAIEGSVCVNSPVVVGKKLVGVIDVVDERYSRVRLLTDKELIIAVRATRESQDKRWRLAKGELRGTKTPAWRQEQPILMGVGFNYDFSDEEGPARELRSGKPLSQALLPTMPIIQQGDQLETTGLDGIFPPGLEVATVSRITPLQEGDYYYEIEAVPTFTQFHSLNSLYILPPMTTLYEMDGLLDSYTPSSSKCAF